ncbi:MAG: PQQ-binding-like beta-propeller repeat protein [Bacteroidetes bacterium]|nr:PQQ-binding-like beta-propeller repeat protein [Bacteroidota bacterium]
MKKGIKIITVTGLLIILPGLISAFGQDWPQWRGSDRDGKIVGFTAPATWPEELAQEWKINVGYGDATPALVKGKIYVFTRQDGNEVLQCLDASTGKVIWKDSYPANAVTGPAARHPGPRSSPTVINGKVIVLGATGIISCLNAESGKLLWRNNDYANMVPAYFTGMSPVVLGNTCFAHLGSAEKSAIIAFDMTSGKIVWKYEGDGPAYASPDIMTFDNVKVVVMQTDKSLLGLSANDGKVLWKIPTPTERRFYNSSSHLINGHKVFYTGQGSGSRAVNISKKGDDYTVGELWKNASYGTTYNTPVLKNGFLFGFSNLGYLYCLNASNGETAWADTTRHRDFGSIIDAGSVMLALSSTSNLVVFKPATDAFRQIALIKVAETPIYAHPVVSGNNIYIKDEESLILYTIE